MKHTLAFILFSLLSVGGGAQTMRDVLRTMPDTMVTLLTKNNMLDFPDYLDTQMRAEVRNRLGGTSEMTRLTDDYTEVRVSASSTMQLKLLPYKGGKVILSIYTYLLNDSTGDSRIRFFDTKWNELEGRRFMPELRREAGCVVGASVAPADTGLTLQVKYPFNIYPQGEEPQAAADREMVLRWNGKKFK